MNIFSAQATADQSVYTAPPEEYIFMGHPAENLPYNGGHFTSTLPHPVASITNHQFYANQAPVPLFQAQPPQPHQQQLHVTAADDRSCSSQCRLDGRFVGGFFLGLFLGVIPPVGWIIANLH